MDNDDNDIYQVDTVVSLFVILLIIYVLITSSFNGKSEVARPYKPTDKETTEFNLKSYNPVYVYRDIFILRDGQLIKLNLQGISDRMLATEGQLTEDGTISLSYSKDDTILSIYYDPKKATTFKINILFGNNITVPDWLIANNLTLTNLTPQDDILSTFSTSPILLYVWNDQHELLPLLYDSIKYKSHKIKFLKQGENSIIWSKSPDLYSLDRIAR